MIIQRGIRKICSKVEQGVFRFSCLFFLITSAVFLDASFVYVANNRIPGSVSVIDTVNNHIVATITNLGRPNRVAIRPDGKYVYVTSSATHHIFVIDTNTKGIVNEILMDSSPVGVAFTPDGKFAYVADSGARAVEVIDTVDFTIRTIPGFPSPDSIVISPNGKYAFVTNTTIPTGSVSIIDTSTLNIVKEINLNTRVFGIAITPDGKFLYVTNDLAAGVVNIIDTTSFDILTLHGFNHPIGVAITPDGKFAYIANSGNSKVSVFDTSSKKVVQEIAFNNSPNLNFIAITPDGDFAYVTDSTISGHVFVIDTHTNTTVATITGFTIPLGLAITPVSSPQNLTGFRQKNKFGLVSENVNRIKWNPALFPVVGYNIYRNGVKIAAVGPSTLKYDDHNQPKGAATYSVAAFSSTDDESFPLSVVVK